MKFDLGHIKKIAVVHVELGSELIFHYLILKKSKGEIDFLKRKEGMKDFEALIKDLSTKFPVLLHFSGKGILNRKARFQENYQHSILLNANIDAFYFSDYIAGKQVFSSVIRKDTVDEVTQLFTDKKIHVISVSSGPFHTAMLNAIIDKPEIKIGGTQLKFQDKQLTDFEKIKEEIDPARPILLGTEYLSESLLPCAAAGASFFNKPEELVFPENDSVFIENLEEARQKNIFTRFGIGMMFFFLILLSANYFYLGHLNQVMMDNSVYLEANNEQINEIANLEEEKARKEKLLQSSGLLNRNFLSFYLMEMANSVPNQITFDQIVLRPLKDEIKERQKIAFEEHLVWVNGRSQTSHVLSRWIEEIEQEEWLSKVDILSYEYVKNEGVFELEMIVF